MTPSNACTIVRPFEIVKEYVEEKKTKTNKSFSHIPNFGYYGYRRRRRQEISPTPGVTEGLQRIVCGQSLFKTISPTRVVNELNSSLFRLLFN